MASASSTARCRAGVPRWCPPPALQASGTDSRSSQKSQTAQLMFDTNHTAAAITTPTNTVIDKSTTIAISGYPQERSRRSRGTI